MNCNFYNRQPTEENVDNVWQRRKVLDKKSEASSSSNWRRETEEVWFWKTRFWSFLLLLSAEVTRSCSCWCLMLMFKSGSGWRSLVLRRHKLSLSLSLRYWRWTKRRRRRLPPDHHQHQWSENHRIILWIIQFPLMMIIIIMISWLLILVSWTKRI